MDVTLLLCDYAESVNGKLYISGAGWNEIAAHATAPIALGMIVVVPWDAANVPHTMTIELIDEDGHRVRLGDPPQEIVQVGTLEAGRPAGMPEGSDLPIPLAFRWPLLPLPAGGYAFVVTVDGVVAARTSFRVVER